MVHRPRLELGLHGLKDRYAAARVRNALKLVDRLGLEPRPNSLRGNYSAARNHGR
jgi:hypothetical protein